MPKDSKKPKKRRLTPEAIASAALELIDHEGLAALTMRRVAAALRVDPMALYRSVPDRDGMIRDIVQLLLGEIDSREQPGEMWVDTMRRMAASYREMALRHPRAYPLVARMSTLEEPALTRARRLVKLISDAGLPERFVPDVLLLDDAFTTGFLLIETDAICREMDGDAHPAADARDDGLVGMMASMITPEAYSRGLDVIYEGLRATFVREQEACTSAGSPVAGASDSVPSPPKSAQAASL